MNLRIILSPPPTKRPFGIFIKILFNVIFNEKKHGYLQNTKPSCLLLSLFISIIYITWRSVYILSTNKSFLNVRKTWQSFSKTLFPFIGSVNKLLKIPKHTINCSVRAAGQTLCWAFTWMMSGLHDSHVKRKPFLSPTYSWGSWGLKRLQILLRTIHLVSGRRFWSQAIWKFLK